MTASIGLLLHTDRRHGVARYASEIAAVTARSGCIAVPEHAWVAAAIDRVHAHFTDRLWGPTPEAALGRLLDAVGSRRLSVTLHDVPQPSDGAMFTRRAEVYRRVIAAADSVVVNSRHEGELVGAIHPSSTPVTVIPLPVLPGDTRAGSVFDPVAAVLGYVYPGKGHREVIAAIAAGRSGLAFRAIGTHSSGHERDVDDLRRLGEELGVEVSITGYLSDSRLRLAASLAAVPVVAHQHISASGSLNSWISAGRRPITIRSRYTEEMEALRPGTLRLVAATELAAAIVEAASDPASTMLGADRSTRPHLADAASAYVDLWRSTAGTSPRR